MNIPKLRFKEFSGEWMKNTLPIKIISGNNYSLDYYSKNGTLLIQGLNIYPNKLVLDNPIYISSDYQDKNDVIIKRNDILIGLNRPIINNKLKACLFNEEKAFLYQRAGILDFNKDNLSNTFLYQYLFTTSFFKQLLVELVGSDQPYIKSDLFKKTKNIFPQKQEQQKIASFLTSIDTKIEQLSSKQQLLEEYKKGIMQKIFYKSNCQGNVCQEIRFNCDDGGEFLDWKEKRLKDITIKKSSNLSANTLEENIGKYKLYGASGLLKRIDFYKEDKAYISIVKDGAGVGRVSLCEKESSVLGTLDIIQPKEDINLEFIYLLLTKIHFQKYMVGSTIPHIYYRDYSLEKINLPQLKEQTKIANFLSSIDKKIQSVSNQLVQTKEFKKGLLQMMFV